MSGAGPGSELAPAVTDWRLVLLSAGVGAVIAGAIYVLVLRKKSFGKTPLNDKLIQLKKAISDAKMDIKDHFETLNDNFNDQVESVQKSIMDSLMSEEMQSAVETIQSVLDKLKAFDEEAKQYDGYGFLLLALVKKAQLEASKEAQQPMQESSTKVWADLKRFGQYAVRMYPLSWVGSNEKIAKNLGVSTDSILMVHFTDDDDGGHCPKFILFFDHVVNSIVLSIRGTFSLKDAVLDAVAEEVEFLEGRAHKGIVSGAEIILDKVLPTLHEAARQQPDYRVVVTGHSLGAGAAELITMRLLGDSSLLPTSTRVECVALAPPPVFRAAKTPSPVMTAAISIYINNYDCVPRLSLASVARLLASVRAVDGLGLSLSQQLSVLMDRQDTGDTMREVKEVVAKVKQDRFPELDHPGTIYHFLKSPGAEEGEMKHRVYLSKSRIFTESILLLENMIADHLHTTYEDVLKNI